MENTELGKLVLKQIETFPETFTMRTFGYRGQVSGYACGTVACLGGHALLLSGYELEAGEDQVTKYLRPDGSRVDATGNEAARVLGLHGQERAVFYIEAQTAVPVFRALTEGVKLGEIPEWREFLLEHRDLQQFLVQFGWDLQQVLVQFG